MTKKSIKDAATAGTSVFDQIARGSVTDTKDANDVKNVFDVNNVNNNQKVQPGRKAKYTGKLERLNFKIPAEIKERMSFLAAKASIEQKRSISLTQYLCDLINAEYERQNE